MCVCVCSYVYVCVYLCVCLCMSVYMCEITPVNTEKRGPLFLPGGHGGRQQAQELQDSVSILGFLPLLPSFNTQQDVRRPAVCAVLVGLLLQLTWS